MHLQLPLLDFPEDSDGFSIKNSSTFTPNLKLPVHRWFRYSAGFSAKWVERVIADEAKLKPRIFDPFAGSGTTLIASETAGVPSWGLDAHPFVARIAKAKLQWRSDPDGYLQVIKKVISSAAKIVPSIEGYPDLIIRCYDTNSLLGMDQLRRACADMLGNSPAEELAWLTLISIIRRVSSAGTAQWQYVLPKRKKAKPANPLEAFMVAREMIYSDMIIGNSLKSPRAKFAQGDSRDCKPVPAGFANLVITSPPYPNNYDYADATRLEMCFLQEISGWCDLQEKVRQHLIVSCSQHVPEKGNDLDQILSTPELAPIREKLRGVCEEMGEIRKTKGGKKTYHLMIASYFRDLAKTWVALRRVCASPSKVCFVVGDSAPYGVYVPVVPWLTKLAESAGFEFVSFEKTRDRNIKWKNRKHRIPLQEGRLWVQG